MLNRLIIYILFLVSLHSVCNAQQDGLKVRTISIDSCYTIIDSLLIDPASIIVKPNLQFTLHANSIEWDCKDSTSIIGSKVIVQYRTLDIDLTTPKFFLDTTRMVEREAAVYIGYDYSPYRSSTYNPLIDQGNLNYSGSLSRGFSVGNSQSLVLNSNLNLQLNGDLGNGIKIVAAISDDNIPIQAEGNTQVLQEFDKVFIKVSKDKTDIIAGDYDLQSEGSYFMNYYKKLQGLRLDNSMNLSSGAKIESRANFAISRGKFARQILQVREGNQGPYKLVGNNGERFLIVLQGSEKVYYDGVLLLRGQDNDYVIDYNNAEIVFTTRRLITREARIIVEYEYTDQNYLRSLYALNSQYETDKFKFNINFYNEQDSRNATGQIELDSIDLAILSGSDGSPQSLLRTGVRSLDPLDISGNTILYKMVIDPVSGDSILVYTKTASEDVVGAVFSEVSAGLGAYVIDTESGANGRVYKYVGQGLGSYLPVIQLIPPEKRQMLSVGAGVMLADDAGFEGEVSLSNFDNNRFSDFDNSFNQGHAFKIGFFKGKSTSENNTWSAMVKANYEFVKEDFNALNPFRNAEFSRDWNITELSRSDEHLSNLSLKLTRKQKVDISYDLSFYKREGQYTGYRHRPQLLYRDSVNSVTLKSDIVLTSGNFESSNFVRPILEVSRKFRNLNDWSVRVKYLSESNRRRSASDDKLMASSFSFNEYYLFLDSPTGARSQFSFYGKRREDLLPRNYELVSSTRINEAGLLGKYMSNNSSLEWNLSYRNFNVEQPELINETNTSTILGRIDYVLRAWDGFLNSTTSYNLGSGQEAKREYQFIKVEKGEGNYIYLGDLNGDGEDQINEYEIAVFADQADYIRVNVVNNEFIRTENQGLNQSLRLMPDKILKDSKGFLSNLLSRITTSSIFRVDQKIQSDGSNGLSILSFNSQDTSLVSYSSLVNNTIFFNRGNPKYDLQLGHRILNNRFVQISGYEFRSQKEYFTRLRFNPEKYLDVIAEIETGIQGYDSEFFDNKDLDIRFVKINPSLNYRPVTNLRLTLKYEYANKKQRINNEEYAVSNELALETTWRQASRSSMLFTLSFVNISYEGEINTPVAYNILSGLNRGRNVLWSVNMTRRLAGNVDLNVNYNGRKTGDSPIVHVARAQIRASF